MTDLSIDSCLWSKCNIRKEIID